MINSNNHTLCLCQIPEHIYSFDRLAYQSHSLSLQDPRTPTLIPLHINRKDGLRNGRQVFYFNPRRPHLTQLVATQAVDGITQSVVGMADAAKHIQEVTRAMAAQNKEDMRNSDNEFNIRNQFLSNAVNAIKQATFSQFNIVICTDQNKDDFQNLTGQILPMDLLNLEISEGKFVDFQVYVFDTGKYLRHGKYETDFWQYWGESKKWYDPAAMHVSFDNAQKKLDPAAVKAQQDQKAQTDKTAAAAAASAKTVQTNAAANEAPELSIEAARNATDPNATPSGDAPSPTAAAAPAGKPMPCSVIKAAFMDMANYVEPTGAAGAAPGPSPSFMSRE